jgi:hypothetical protein
MYDTFDAWNGAVDVLLACFGHDAVERTLLEPHNTDKQANHSSQFLLG